jgi:tyrosyl-tRNA synthetase
MLRSTTIMGRKESEVSDTAMLVYPAMQSADIFALKVNLAHAGTDQRNVHVVARESASALGEEKPVAIHHHLLQGLLQPVLIIGEDGKQVMDMEAAKMSKSKPNSAVFIHDDPETIKKKINAAYAPEGVVEFNPILDWCKYLVFYTGEESLTIKRDEKWGGDMNFKNYEELEKAYAEKQLHPMDLKKAVADYLIEILEPARKYFEDPKRKSALEEIERLTQK